MVATSIFFHTEARKEFYVEVFNLLHMLKTEIFGAASRFWRVAPEAT